MSDATNNREVVQPLTRSAQDYDSLLAFIGDARFVCSAKLRTARTSFTPSARRSRSGLLRSAACFRQEGCRRLDRKKRLKTIKK